MPRPIYIVDAFTDRPFAWNPAAVVLLEPQDGPAGDDYLRNVAREMNLSETAFVAFDAVPDPKRRNCFGLRWFTPVREVELCGHATLAAAQVLYDAARVDLHTPICFDTMSGILRAAPDADYGGFTLDFPATPPTSREPPGELLMALALDRAAVRFAGHSAYDWMLVLDDAARVREVSPDFGELAKISTRGAILTAPGGGEFDVVSRCFYPALGIDEDPVTGSAHCAIVPYFVRTLGRDRLRCHQASARGGVINARLVEDRVFLGGQARTVLRGDLLV